MLEVKLEKDDIISMLLGCQPIEQACYHMRKLNLMTFDELAGVHKFNVEELNGLDDESLFCIYQAIKFKAPNPVEFIEEAIEESKNQNL